MTPYFRELFEAETVVARRDHQKHSKALSRLATGKEIEAVLPGIYALPNHREFLGVRAAALRKHDPDAIVMGRAAARLSYWPELEATKLQAAVKHRRAVYPGFDFVRRKVPADLVVEVGGVRMTSPALTALDLCLEVGGDGIDEALRRNTATLDDLHAALNLIPHQPGNDMRRQFLQESSEEPWSAAERMLHGLLREAGIPGWQGNVSLWIDGQEYIVDVLFRRERLAVEVDGRWYHGEARFEMDRRRQNILVLDGWRILRFTWRMLEQEPQRVIEVIERGLWAKSPTSAVA